MPMPVITVDDLATFSGKQAIALGAYAPQAIDQAALLVQTVTGVFDLPPEDLQGSTLYKYSVMEIAYTLNVNQEYLDVVSNPFSGESIGSYSYSKSTIRTVASSKLSNGDDSGLTWLPLYEDYLDDHYLTGVKNIDSGQIQGMEYDGVGINAKGELRILGPNRDPRYFDATRPSPTYSADPHW